MELITYVDEKVKYYKNIKIHVHVYYNSKQETEYLKVSSPT